MPYGLMVKQYCLAKGACNARSARDQDSPALASAVMASSQATDGNVILIDDARCEEMDLSYYDYGSAGELRDNVGEDGTRMHDDYSSTVSSKKSTVEPILILGESEPRMQRLGVTCPRVRHHARVFADKIAQRVRGLTLDPLSPIIHQVKMSDHRDDTVTYVVYAVHNKHGKLLKIGLASNLKTRKELGYSDNDDITVRMIFSIDNMPPNMDKAVVEIYHEFWDATVDDPNVDPYFHRLERLVRDEVAGALGADRNIVGRLIEYGLQRECKLAAPFEMMTGDADVLSNRKTEVESAANDLRPILDDVLQLDEHSGEVMFSPTVFGKSNITSSFN